MKRGRPKRVNHDGSGLVAMQIARNAVLLLLRGYKWAVSPLFPPSCRYVPTCSEYAMEAVERYGAGRGAGMAIARLLRCHPFVRGGYDPVVHHDRSARDILRSPGVGRGLQED